jgi:pyruvate/2-oxoglutarate dehydrogenase complex dihydrolipoamide acyltransferase (E2) component
VCTPNSHSGLVYPAGIRFEGVTTIEIRIPKLGMEMTEATLSAWLVGDGTSVVEDQPIYLLETDKVETEIPAPVAGVLRWIGQEGTTYPVGEVIGQLDQG